MDQTTFEKEYLQMPLEGCLTITDIDRLPPGTTFKMSRDYYYSHRALWDCRNILYCPARETAYKLDPNDPRDRKLLEHYANPTTDPLSHPMYRSPEANRFFINTLARKRALEHHRHPSPSTPQEQADG